MKICPISGEARATGGDMSSLWGMYMMGSFVSMVSIATAPHTTNRIPGGPYDFWKPHRFLPTTSKTTRRHHFVPFRCHRPTGGALLAWLRPWSKRCHLRRNNCSLLWSLLMSEEAVVAATSNPRRAPGGLHYLLRVFNNNNNNKILLLRII